MQRGYLTKEKIFNQAVRLFAEKDYKVVTMKEIAKAADITEPAVYRYYENKAAILDEILIQLKRKLQKYILTKEQVDRYIETDTTRQLLERCLGSFEADEDSLFVSRAYRIANMEYLTNKVAMDLFVLWLQDSVSKSVQYVFDSLMERGRIPVYDTQFVSAIWADFILAETVRQMSRQSEGGSEVFRLGYNNTVAELIVEMVITGRIP